MASAPLVYLGIDVLASHKPFSYIALDGDCRPLAQGQGKLDEVLAYAAGQSSACVAVNGPERPGQALPPQEPSQASLFAKGGVEPQGQTVSLVHAPAVESDCPAWMRRGFAVYAALRRFGYCAYPQESERQYVQVQSEAGYASLLGHLPYEHHALEGRLQRQMALYQQGLSVPDPMGFFEEVTPFKLLQGHLPLQKILSAYELNAWLAAYTAWLLYHHPERVSCLGLEDAGSLVLPLPGKK